MKKILALSIVTTTLFTGCMTMSNLKPIDATLESSNSIVIIGIKPNYRIMFGAGIHEDKEELFEDINRKKVGIRKVDVWKPDSSVFAGVANVQPEENYIVLKLPARTGKKVYSLVQALPNGIFGPIFRPCNGMSIPSFEAPAGKAIYVGDINYVHEQNKLYTSYSYDLSQAKTSLQGKYPNLAIEGTTMTFPAVSNLPCSSMGGITIQIPIYIPAR